ncbi:LysM domain-containing protein [Lacticaseibacillus pabuli]|uniref:LysM domain-containing protein n=1 Tax=Lacticaseibacillus pabuli TaxID=3025672 RepID=A0ABY7WSC8_9LACO|nr:LysM domain-containing protein [Lacticaseibacillus sp. KACC 23028]WDF83088.1 LysM domain-containing protein [Lacticaseibacillus sp. KACC 23028]
MAKEDSTAEYIRRIRQQIAGVSHGEGMRQLEVERNNVTDRFSARALDELIHEEKTSFRKRILIRLGGWAVVLAAIFFVLIYFGGSGGSSKPTAKPAKTSRSSVSTVLTDNKPKKKSKSKTKKPAKKVKKATSLSSSASSSTSSVAASSSSKQQPVASSSSRAVASSKAPVASSRPAAQTRQPAASSRRVVTQAPVRRAPARPVQPSTYTVKKGDNLYRIAVNHGTTLKQLQAINGMGNSHAIMPGQTIRLR